MCLQMAFGDETLTTALEVALEWPVSRVGTHVSLEITCLAE